MERPKERGLMRPRRQLNARALALAACVGVVSAQVAFDASTPGTYLTYCVSAGTGEVFTPNCLDSYNDLVQTVKLLIGSDTDPYHFNVTDIATLEGLCSATPKTPSCVTQMTNLASAYIGGLTPPAAASASACESEFAPNAALLFQNALPFVCLPNEAGASCMVQVAQALAGAGEMERMSAESALPTSVLHLFSVTL